MNWYIEALKKYAVFSGRSRRKEYWLFVLFNIVVTIGFFIIDGLIGTFSVEAEMGLLGTIYTIAVIIPSIAVGVRRLHDIGRSGWWILIGLIPIVGYLILIVFFAMESESGTNKFGDNPKEAI